MLENSCKQPASKLQVNSSIFDRKLALICVQCGDVIFVISQNFGIYSRRTQKLRTLLESWDQTGSETYVFDFKQNQTFTFLTWPWPDLEVKCKNRSHHWILRLKLPIQLVSHHFYMFFYTWILFVTWLWLWPVPTLHELQTLAVSSPCILKHFWRVWARCCRYRGLCGQ